MTQAVNVPKLLPLSAAIFAGLLNPGVATAEDKVLPTVTVEATAETQENTGYQATQTRVGKVAQDPHDIPQAVTTVTHQLM